MFQVAATLLFVAACGFGLTVILSMLGRNADAILSALIGEGAFADAPQPANGPPRSAHTMRRINIRKPVAAPAASFSANLSQQFSRAAA